MEPQPKLNHDITKARTKKNHYIVPYSLLWLEKMAMTEKLREKG